MRDALLSSSIPNAALIGCAVATDHLIVSSVSNWGAYALANAAALVAAQVPTANCQKIEISLYKHFSTTFRYQIRFAVIRVLSAVVRVYP